jgi:hypothetical protein
MNDSTAAAASGLLPMRLVGYGTSATIAEDAEVDADQDRLDMGQEAEELVMGPPDVGDEHEAEQEGDQLRGPSREFAREARRRDVGDVERQDEERHRDREHGVAEAGDPGELRRVARVAARACAGPSGIASPRHRAAR